MSALRKLKQLVPASAGDSMRPAWRAFRKWRMRAYQRAANFVGLNLARRRDYYSVLPVLEDLYRNESRWNRPSALIGVRYDVEAMRSKLDELIMSYASDLLAPEKYAELASRGFGPGYPRVDGICLYAMIRALKPARYFEVGSGLSTYVAWLAGQENAKEGHPLSITCVEPYPSDLLRNMAGVELIVDEVQNVPSERFQVLDSGDVLFIDSTHALKIDSDVAYLFLEIVPRVKAGVHIHVHDIPFPYNVPYPASIWVLGNRWPVFWQEAMVLQTFLAFNDSFEVTLSVPLLKHEDEAFVASRIPGYPVTAEPQDITSSLWMRRVK